MNYIFADLESTSTYIEQFAQAHVDAPYFVFGTEEDVMQASATEGFHYPCLWLDLPHIVTEDNEMANLMEKYRFSITCMYSGELDNKVTRIQAYQKAVRLLQNLQNKLKQDNRKGILVCELSGMQKMPLNPLLFNSSHYGYILNFEASFHANDIL
ncbi:hypothetical protein [Flectobacillus major]|uniref:hypothetical protein n=1 Tax=Flectobacillus major TaxID=103 RepID=UPI00041E5C67|nr:hypothetical protein [Flectobacillus major]